MVVQVLSLVALLMGLLLAIETLRPVPWWPRMTAARPGTSPRQRRWLGVGIALAMAGQLVALGLEGDTGWWGAAFLLIAAGLGCAFTSAFIGPTSEELDRRRQRLADEPVGRGRAED